MPIRRPGAVLRDDSEHALQAVGRELRAARLARGEDLHDIAAYLRIRPAYLAALEQGDVAATPGGPMRPGSCATMATIWAWMAGRWWPVCARPSIPWPRRARSATASRLSESRRPTASVVTASLVLMGALYAGYHLFVATGEGPPIEIARGACIGPAATRAGRARRRPPLVMVSAVKLALEPVPVAEAVTSPAPDVTSAVAAESASAAGCRPSSCPSTVGRHPPRQPLSTPQPGWCWSHAQDSWVQLRSPDRAFVRTRTMLPGERFVVPERGDLALWTGNAGGIELVVDGQNVGLVGAPGATVRNFSLAPDGLKARQTAAH